MNNLSPGSGRESAGFIVAWKRSNVRGAKEPYQIGACRRKGGPLGFGRSHVGFEESHYGRAATAVESLSFETQARPKGQAGAEVSVLRPV